MCFGVKFGSDLFLMEEAPATSPYQGVVGTGRLAEKRYIWRCHSDAAFTGFETMAIVNGAP